MAKQLGLSVSAHRAELAPRLPLAELSAGSHGRARSARGRCRKRGEHQMEPRPGRQRSGCGTPRQHPVPIGRPLPPPPARHKGAAEATRPWAGAGRALPARRIRGRPSAHRPPPRPHPAAPERHGAARYGTTPPVRGAGGSRRSPAVPGRAARTPLASRPPALTIP